MGRKTKAQRERKAKKVPGANQVVIDPTTTVTLPRRSQMPSGAKMPLRRADVKAAAQQRPDISKLMETFKSVGIARNSDPVARQKAGDRMKAVLDLLKAQPKPILEQLTEIGVPYFAVRTPNAKTEHPDAVVLMLNDIKAADVKLASKGSLYAQMYKEGT